MPNPLTPARRHALTRFALILGCGWATVASAQQSPPHPLTLAGALEYAHAHSPRVAAARQGVVTEGANVAAARDRRWPVLDVGGAVRWAEKPTQTAVSLPPLSGLGDLSSGQPFAREHLNAAVSVTVPLYEGGQIRAATRLAEAQRDLAATQEAHIERALDFDVIRTYAGLVELEQDARAADRSRQTLEESRRVIAEMLRVGRAARVDLLKVDTRLGGVRAKLIAYQNAERIAAGQLNALLGRPVDTPLIAQDTLPRPVVGLSADQAAQAALQNNTTYQLAAARVRVATRTVDVARAQLRPSVSLGAAYEAQGVDPLSRHYVATPVAGVLVSVPVYDRSLSRQVDVAESRAQERRLDLEQWQLDIEQHAQTAYLEVRDASERIQATVAAIASADEVLRIEQAMERLGRGTIEHVLDAEAARFTADADYASALADYTTAVAALERETGLRFIQREPSP